MKDRGARLAPSPPQLNSAPFMPFVVFCTCDNCVNFKRTRMPLSGKAIILSLSHTHTHTHTLFLSHYLALNVCLSLCFHHRFKIFILFQNAPVNEAVLEREKILNTNTTMKTQIDNATREKKR